MATDNGAAQSAQDVKAKAVPGPELSTDIGPVIRNRYRTKPCCHVVIVIG